MRHLKQQHFTVIQLNSALTLYSAHILIFIAKTVLVEPVNAARFRS